MSYCINPNCPQPQNPDKAPKCLACGSTLLLRDRFQIVQPLGQGGFGATFLAKDVSLPGNPICVIKELRPSTTDTNILEMARQLFKREAQTLGKVGHHPARGASRGSIRPPVSGECPCRAPAGALPPGRHRSSCSSAEGR